MTRSILVYLFYLGTLFVPSFARAAPFYQENFNFDSTSAVSPYDALTATGWAAYKSTSRIGVLGYLKVASGLARNQPVFNSFPLGPDDGYAWWGRPVDSLTIFSDEYSFNIAKLDRVSYLQRLAGSYFDPTTQLPIPDGTRLALRVKQVGGVENWFISDSIERQLDLGVWQEVNFAPRSITFSVVPARAGIGPRPPLVANSGKALPNEGIVTGFGVYVERVSDRVRIDSYSLNDALEINGFAPQPIPESGQGVRPIPPNDDGEGEIPGVPPLPTATPNNQVSIYTQCPASSAVTKKAKVARKARSKLLASIKGKSLQALRDRVIIELLASGIRASSLEQVTLRDLYIVKKISYINLFGSDRMVNKLSTSMNKNIRNYTRIAGIKDPISPLFRVIESNKVQPVALCSEEINSIFVKAIKNSGVSRQVKFIN